MFAAMHRRAFLASAAWLAAAPALAQPRPDVVASLLDHAAVLNALETAVVARGGEVLAARGYRGHSVAGSTNIKSASKSVISALIGIAIDRRILAGPEQRIAPLLRADLPPNPDPRLAEITIGNLLSMQSGLERTSGMNYGGWVASRNWVRDVLARPFVDEPGGRMLYSTGSTHLLSAILTRATGKPTLQLAREWLGALPGFAIAGWERDPQGIYFGGNQMAMTPRSLLAFGELYRNGGRMPGGPQIVSRAWIDQSWTPRTASQFTGDAYGYGWFLRPIAGHDGRYAWGFGGQMLYVIPSAEVTIVMTSDDTRRSGRTGYRDQLHAMAAEVVGSLTVGRM